MKQRPITEKIKARLHDYIAMLREIDNQTERLDLLEAKMQAPPSPDLSGMPRGSGTPTDRTGMMVMRKMEIEEQIAKSTAEELKERQAIEALIQQLAKPDERAVLRLRYFDRGEWEEITGVLFGDRADYIEKADTYQKRTFRLHGSALLALAKVAEEDDHPTTEEAAQGHTGPAGAE
ncbi:DUF1492 domain-containing protein [Gemmiger formicilis]